ncbi:unnamed protein product [Calypogeia fissa]
MGKSKKKKGPGNDLTVFPTVAAQPQPQQHQQQQLPKVPARAATSSSTPGRGEVGSPFSQPLTAKVHHRATATSANHGSNQHLPTITRGPQGLRQMHQHHGSSPLQRTPANQAAFAKIEFLSQIATWAASNKIPSLGAFYGERLASACQTAGIPSPVVNSQCERCESVLLPGVNFSVRSRSKKRKNKMSSKGNAGEATATVNSFNTVVHRCNYCKYENQKVRTLKDDVKTKLAEEAARAQMKDLANSRPSGTAEPTTPVHRQAQALLKASAEGSVATPVTPVASKPVALSPASVLQVDMSASSGTKKRKRKGWTGLKAMSTSLHNRESPNPERRG